MISDTYQAASDSAGPGATAFAVALLRVDAGESASRAAATVVAQMTTAEKFGCLDGDVPFWPGMTDMMSGGYTTRTWPAAVVERLGVPGLHFADGPRGCVVGAATTFPVSMARGASFDPDLERDIGRAIGRELRSAGANFTGAVCMNLLRHPAWGRAQETYGEDPLHVGEMAVALTLGLQEHVMACMKHFALNSMENARFKVDVRVDERALHEVYLPHFKRVAQAGVASVMSAYNSVNGTFAGDNSTLLTSILRDEWGWDGFVITDFIAGLRDPLGSIAAGCNIEMPFAQQRALALEGDENLPASEMIAVEARVTEVVATFLRFAAVLGTDQPTGAPVSDVRACDEHRRLARRAAVESAVLLRNEGLLPVNVSSVSRVAVVGRLADQVNLGDAGSSNIRHTPDPVTPLQGLRNTFGAERVVFHETDASIGQDADLVVVVVGLTRQDEGEYLGQGMNEALQGLLPPPGHSTLGHAAASHPPSAELGGSEPAESQPGAPAPDRGEPTPAGGASGSAAGGDRDSLRLHPGDEDLISVAQQHSDRVVVVVIAGSAVVMPWLDRVSAALMLWYAGSEAGNALGDILTGAEPGGRLPFAVPHDQDDLVSFDRDVDRVEYGLLHGQWWLDANATPAHRSFGFGLSYGEITIDDHRLEEDGAVVTLSNRADCDASTVVQVYGSVPDSAFERPPKRLVGFRKVRVGAGQVTTATVDLDLSQLDIRHDGRWLTEDRAIELAVGLNAAALERLG